MKNNNHKTTNNQPDNQRNETTTNNHSHNTTSNNNTTNNNTTRTNHETRTNLINDYSKLNANGQQISWLIFDSGKTPYSIAKETGVPDGNLYLVKRGERSINNLSLSVASKLTAYAIKLQGQQGGRINKDD